MKPGVIADDFTGTSDLEAAVYAMEELEATARQALLLRGEAVSSLSPDHVNRIVECFDVDWN